MSYTIKPEDLAGINEVDKAFGTEALLPSWEDIPPEFKGKNLYTDLCDAIFGGNQLPNCELEFIPGYEEKADQVRECVEAHLRSWGPKHEHKIAGVAFMMSKMFTLTTK